MGAPYFQVKHFEETHGIVAVPANFALYGDPTAQGPSDIFSISLMSRLNPALASMEFFRKSTRAAKAYRTRTK
jgi:hypothetical protein